MPTANSNQFDSDGFDLDAANVSKNQSITDGEGAGDAGVVYEIGGGATTETPSATEGGGATAAGVADALDVSPVAESERLKDLGNVEFRKGNHLDACDYYSDAIEACPCGEGVGPTGDDLLKMRDDFEEAERERNLERHNRDMNRRRKRSTEGSEVDASEENEEVDGAGPAEFIPPPHCHGPKLAVYHANRAATLLHLGRFGEAMDNCDVALLLNPTYVKALLRRCTVYERMEKTEDALRDAKRAVELDPRNVASRKNAARLQKIEDERLENLKVETMDKLKDLGNSLLGNFGLSLNNFNAVQDPNSGSYSISFDQNK